MRGVDGAGSPFHCAGSPVHPHMRGVDFNQKLFVLAANRFIPTCVGSMVRVQSSPDI